MPRIASPKAKEEIAAARAQAERDWELIERLRERNRDKDPAEVEKDVAEAIEAVRLERRRIGR